MTKKLVYEESQISVKPNESVTLADGSTAIVKNIRAPRKDSGQGRVTLLLGDGRKVDYPPAAISAIWI